MLSLSTSFFGGRIEDGEALVATLESFGVPGVELEYRIREKACHALRPALRASGLRVTSVHNFFPHPAPFDRLPPSGDLFSLADLDRERRRLAVAWTDCGSSAIQIASKAPPTRCRLNDTRQAAFGRCAVRHPGKIQRLTQFISIIEYYDLSLSKAE